MSKEAKIGLGIILGLLIVLGGVVTWKLRSRSSAATALADAGAKEKSHRESEVKAGKTDAGTAEFKSRYSREGRETPKVLSPAASGHAPKRESERDLWDVGSDHRKPRESAGEATVVPPPPSMMPEPPTPDNADPNDRYGLNRRSAAPSVDIMAPPAGAIAAAGGKHGGGAYGERSSEDYRLRDRSPTDVGVAPEGLQPAKSPNALRGEYPNRGPSRPAPDYRDNLREDYGPYDRDPSASFVGRERHRPRGNDLAGANEPDYASKNGSRGDGTYDVQPNDSFWTISEKIYGTGSYFEALEELNRGKAVDGQLKVGQNILTPDASELEKKFPGKCPKENHREVLQNRNATLVSARNLRGTRNYTVVEGDTLFDIARYELGKASRWAEIYELNQNVLGKDFDYLIPGTELALPEDSPASPDPITRKPDWGRRR